MADPKRKSLGAEPTSLGAEPDPSPTSTRQPYWDRLREAASAVGKDAAEGPVEAAKEFISPFGPVKMGMRTATDLGNLGFAFLGAGAAGEHAEPHLERRLGTPTTVKEVSPTEAAIDPGREVGALLWNMFANQSPEQRAKTGGDVADFASQILSGEALGEIGNIGKIAKIMKTEGVTFAKARELLKAGHTLTVPVREPSIVKRAGEVLRQTRENVRQRRTASVYDPVPITPEQEAQGTHEGQALVARMAKKADPTGARLRGTYEGKPIMSSEVLGQEAQGQHMMISRREGKTGENVSGFLHERIDQMPDRVLGDFAEATGMNPAEIRGNFEEAHEAARKEFPELYAKVYGTGSHDSDKLRQLTSREVFQSAVKQAYRDMHNQGKNPEELVFIKGRHTQVVRNPSTNQLERILGDPDAYIEIRRPNAETLDYIKRAMGEKARGLDTPKTKNQYRIANENLKEFREEMFNIIPGYRELMGKVGEPLEQERLFKEAPKLFSTRTKEFEFDKAVKGMSDSEKKALIAGGIDDLYQRARDGRLRLKDLAPASFRAKMTKLLGEEKANALFKKLDVEANMQVTGGQIVTSAGSPTYRLAQAASDQEKALAAFEKTRRVMMPFLRRGIHGTPAATGEFILGLMKDAYATAHAPVNEAARNEVGRLLQLPPNELADFLETLKLNPPTVKEIMKEADRARIRMKTVPAAAAQAVRHQQYQRGQ